MSASRCLIRNGKDVTPTEAGERLLSYARRLLSLAEEARDVVARPGHEGAVRLGIPEDFAAYRLAKLLAAFSRSHPACGSTCAPTRAPTSSAISNAASSISRCSSARPARRAASRCGRSACIGSPARAIRAILGEGSVPLIGFPTGCLYRAGAIHALESAGRAWHMAYTVSNLSGIQAAVAAGMGLSILSEMAIQADHRVLTARDGFAPIDKTEVALVASPDASPATLRLADRLAEFCDTVQAKAA